MKKILASLISILYVFVLEAQNESVINLKTDKKLLPTKYAVILYSNQVSDTTSNNKMIASHWQNSGGGT
ncbi:MAG TPA: hypothetical protein VN958_02705, partial [Chitinophagaceae bacterium]|nr:hypothetical protein [Chitinophagaceae bacterium]